MLYVILTLYNIAIWYRFSVCIYIFRHLHSKGASGLQAVEIERIYRYIVEYWEHSRQQSITTW